MNNLAKRPFDLLNSDNQDKQDVPEVLSNPIKRRRLEQIPKLLDSNKNAFHNKFQNQFDASQLHNVPSDILPILNLPLKPGDFFTDLDTDDMDPVVSQKVATMLKSFPPPVPPSIPEENNENNDSGIMIPFIFPKPPIIKPDVLIDDNRPFLHKRTRGSISANNDENDNDNKNMVDLAPLPFPPTNYMPYPLMANKSSLTPFDVFTDFLDASASLPRIDMVVASAAGTLFDMKDKALQEGFTIQDHEIVKDTISDGSDESEDSYINFVNNVDTSNEFDPFDKGPIKNTVGIKNLPGDYLSISPNTSNVKNKEDHQVTSDEYSSEIDYSERVEKFMPTQIKDFITFNKDISSINGINKEKRRQELSKSLNSIKDYEHKKKLEIFLQKKQDLLQKVDNLRKSTIFLSDDNNQHIKDPELIAFKERLEEKRDLDLLKLKFSSNYEYLRSSLSFYQDSNKSYKKFNGLMTNKLLKLKNFLDFQKVHFNELLKNNKTDDAVFDLSNKESTKLYHEIIDNDHQSKVKEILKLAMTNPQDKEIPELIKQMKFNEFNPNDGESSGEDGPTFNDFMPLTNGKEFDLITGNLPLKLKTQPTKENNKHIGSLKHEIFKSSLYDPTTSGSDTNNSESNVNPLTPKRRGRRSAGMNANLNDAYSDDVETKYSEAVLLAKILKHFMGPQQCSNDQFNDDLQKMGVNSKWPR